MRINIQRLFVIAVLSIGAAMCNAQSSDSNDGVYNALVQQAQSLLASSPDQSLTLSQQIVKLNPARWEGYDLTGLALTSLRRYDEATVQFGQALAHAPATAQPGISAHLKHCVQAETGPAPATEVAPGPQYPQPQPAPQAQPATTQDAAGPSMEVTVQYILDLINNHGANGGVIPGSDDYGNPTTSVDRTFGAESPAACILKINALHTFQVGKHYSASRSTYQINMADIDLSPPGGLVASLKGRSAILETKLVDNDHATPPHKEPALDAWMATQADLLQAATTCPPRDNACTITQRQPESVYFPVSADSTTQFLRAMRHLGALCGATASASPAPPKNLF